jgi:hypothetical protein
MRGELGAAGNDLDFANLQQSTLSLLCRIDRQIRTGRIRPWWEDEAPPSSMPPEPLRIGVFPIAANPFHWAHLLAGLLAMERYGLDQVRYVIAGRDRRKPDLAPEDERHSMARAVLQLFSPLLSYSPVARGTDFCGEENLFRLLAEFPDRPIHAFYIAGSDHYQRTRPETGSPDTIARLEDGITRRLHGFDPSRFTVSLVFLQRGERRANVPTWLDVQFVPRLPVETSSTAIRAALGDREHRGPLWTLPFVALKSIKGKNLYSATRRDLASSPRGAEPSVEPQHRGTAPGD